MKKYITKKIATKKPQTNKQKKHKKLKKTKTECKVHSVHHCTQKWNLFYTLLKAAPPSAFIMLNRFNLKSSYDSADVGITNFPSQTAEYISPLDKSVNSTLIYFKKGPLRLAVAKEHKAGRVSWVSSVTNLWKNCAVDPFQNHQK